MSGSDPDQTDDGEDEFKDAQETGGGRLPALVSRAQQAFASIRSAAAGDDAGAVTEAATGADAVAAEQGDGAVAAEQGDGAVAAEQGDGAGAAAADSHNGLAGAWEITHTFEGTLDPPPTEAGFESYPQRVLSFRIQVRACVSYETKK